MSPKITKIEITNSIHARPAAEILFYRTLVKYRYWKNRVMPTSVQFVHSLYHRDVWFGVKIYFTGLKINSWYCAMIIFQPSELHFFSLLSFSLGSWSTNWYICRFVDYFTDQFSGTVTLPPIYITGIACEYSSPSGYCDLFYWFHNLGCAVSIFLHFYTTFCPEHFDLWK